MLGNSIALGLACALLVSACADDNPVDQGGEAHAEAVGLILRSSGEELVRYENGQVSGEIQVGRGRETALLSVRFLDEDGDLFTPDEKDGFSLGWEVGDERIAMVEKHQEDGPWAFHIVGLEVGQTTLVLRVEHEGHADFVSREMEIHVIEGGPGEAHEHGG